MQGVPFHSEAAIQPSNFSLNHVWNIVFIFWRRRSAQALGGWGSVVYSSVEDLHRRAKGTLQGVVKKRVVDLSSHRFIQRLTYVRLGSLADCGHGRGNRRNATAL